MSLIHWWPLNGNTNDLGLVTSTVTTPGATVNSSGLIGQCYTTTNASRGIYATFSALTAKHPVSITGWYNITTSSTYNPIFAYGDSASSGLCIRGPRLERGDGSKNYDTPIGLNVTANKWQHIAVVYDGTNIIVYQNGAFVTSLEAPTSGIGSNNGKIRIGSFWATDSSTVLANDFRIYDHALSAKEVKEISNGLILHYNFEDEYLESTVNLGNTSANYSNMNYGTTYAAIGWGGDAGTVVFYNDGGYNNYPYKVYHKTATGSGGIYYKTANDITIEAGKTYTMSVYIKASVNINNASAYSFNINRGSDNNYINYGTSFNITTEWQRFTKTFTATSAQAGSYGEMSIIYDDTVTDYYIYYSGFQIEEKDHATPYVSGSRNNVYVTDNSGYGYNGTIPVQAVDAFSIYKNTTAIGNGNHYANFDGATTKFKVTSPTAEAKTLSAWIKGNIATATAQVVIADYKSNLGISFYNTGAKLIVATTSAKNAYTVANYNSSGWNHIVVVKDTACYINGQALVSTGTTEYSTHSTDEFCVGCRNTTGYTNYFSGQIADIKLFAKAFTADEVLGEYNRKAAMDKAGNFYTGTFIQESQDMNAVITKKQQLKINNLYEDDTLTKAQIGEDYTQLEFIQSSGTQYINTGYYWHSDVTQITADIIITSNASNQSLWGSEEYTATSGSARYFAGIPHGSNGNYSYYIGTGPVSGLSIGLNTRATVVATTNANNQITATVNGTTKINAATYSGTCQSHASTVFDSASKGLIYIFSNHNSNRTENFAGTQQVGGMKLYSFKMKDSGILVRDFIPVKQNSTGYIGLYDKVENKFYANAGSGTFTAGSATGQIISSIRAKSLIER